MFYGHANGCCSAAADGAVDLCVPFARREMEGDMCSLERGREPDYCFLWLVLLKSQFCRDSGEWDVADRDIVFAQNHILLVYTAAALTNVMFFLHCRETLLSQLNFYLLWPEHKTIWSTFVMFLQQYLTFMHHFLCLSTLVCWFYVDVFSPVCVPTERQSHRPAVWREQLSGGPGAVLPSWFQVCTTLPEDSVCVGLCR